MTLGGRLTVRHLPDARVRATDWTLPTIAKDSCQGCEHLGWSDDGEWVGVVVHSTAAVYDPSGRTAVELEREFRIYSACSWRATVRLIERHSLAPSSGPVLDALLDGTGARYAWVQGHEYTVREVGSPDAVQRLAVRDRAALAGLPSDSTPPAARI